MWDAIFSRLPTWAEPVVDYILHTGLKNTLIIAGISVALSLVVGVLLGTLLTLRFLPLQAGIRLYIEVWRGLPIIVTIFFCSSACRRSRTRPRSRRCGYPRSSPRHSRPVALGERTDRRGDPWRRPVDSARAARGILGPRLRLGRPSCERRPASGSRRLLPPLVSLSVNIIQNSTLARFSGCLRFWRPPNVPRSGLRSRPSIRRRSRSRAVIRTHSRSTAS